MSQKIVSDEQIKDNLRYAELSCKQISEITGLSIYASKKLRIAMLNDYHKAFPYGKGAHVRTEHFVKWYDSPRITKIYEELYNVKLEK